MATKKGGYTKVGQDAPSGTGAPDPQARPHKRRGPGSVGSSQRSDAESDHEPLDTLDVDLDGDDPLALRSDAGTRGKAGGSDSDSYSEGSEGGSGSGSAAEANIAKMAAPLERAVGGADGDEEAMMILDDGVDPSRNAKLCAPEAEGGGVLSREGFFKKHTFGLSMLTIGLTVLSIWILASEGALTKSVSVVWAYGWITAASTGLGALPFLWLHKVDTFWMGVCNAVAAGMMAAASAGLVVEALNVPAAAPDEQQAGDALPVWLRTLLGVLVGMGFIYFTKGVLDKYEDLKFSGIAGADARKMLLIVAVMTLHSFSEGVGIGVAFGGRIGVFISTTLAIHNVPEGLAIALVLIPRKVHVGDAALWAVFSSIPQPIMAVPAYLSVATFLPFLPAGLGFAGGAMAWVALFDLLVEAHEECGALVTGCACVLSAGCMATAQVMMK